MRQIRSSIEECIADAAFVSVGLTDTVEQAVAGMRHKGTHCAVVIEDNDLVGIFTESDYLNRVAIEGKAPDDTQMREVMTPNPVRLRSFDCVSYAINQMAVRGVRHLPITDPSGRTVSVLDVRLVMMHLIKVFAEIEAAPERTASESEDEWIDIGGG